MKVLLLGSDGFIGKRVVEKAKNHELFMADRTKRTDANYIQLNLLNQKLVKDFLGEIRPDVVINCAGTVENNESALETNPVITENLLQGILQTNLKVNKVIILGSAGEYGNVDRAFLPVTEETPCRGENPYARSKIEETAIGLQYSRKKKVPVVVARIFNPIGPGMSQRLLLPSLINQIESIKHGKKDFIEMSRLDSKRDYVSVDDIALALWMIVEKKTNYDVYNIGSGKETTNKTLLKIILEEYGLSLGELGIKEVSERPEPSVASWADISRIRHDLGWEPQHTLEETIKDIIKNIKE